MRDTLISASFFCIAQRVLVEHVSLQHLGASVAAASFSPLLAVHADVRLRWEVYRGFLNTAFGAGVARYTSVSYTHLRAHET